MSAAKGCHVVFVRLLSVLNNQIHFTNNSPKNKNPFIAINMVNIFVSAFLLLARG